MPSKPWGLQVIETEIESTKQLIANNESMMEVYRLQLEMLNELADKIREGKDDRKEF